MKVCNKCGQEKELCEFNKDKRNKDGHKNQCKSCKKEYRKDYRNENKEKIRERQKEYDKKRYQENKDKIIEKINEYRKNRYKTDPLFRLKLCIRSMVKRAIKTKRTEKIIGCTYQELKEHLESQFTEGMSWQNYGKFGWHVDHILPLSWFVLTNPEEVAKANHYTNLQPLWAEDNLFKGNRFAS